jgi:hypothetical protein
MNKSPSSEKSVTNMVTSLNPALKPKILRIKTPSKTSGSNPKGRNQMGKINRSHTKIKGKSLLSQKKRSPDLLKKENQAIIARSTLAKMVLHLSTWNHRKSVGKD